jgi:hypothetical protein
MEGQGNELTLQFLKDFDIETLPCPSDDGRSGK